MTRVRARRVRRCAMLLALLGALGACGQTGPLYLPGDPSGADAGTSAAEPPLQDEDDERRGDAAP